MSESLISLGLDVGTTSTQMVVSRLTVENRAGQFSVPEMVIDRREILYRSPVHFTPLIREELVDAAALRQILDQEYRNAGIDQTQVDTGAIIITGETSRKENARAVLEELVGYAGEFVVATAGPALESVLAARGSGAVEWSEATGKPVLHMDIGGGTSNLAWIQGGKILSTGCLNVGGRLVKLGADGTVLWISTALKGLCDFRVGQRLSREDLAPVAELLVKALEMAAGLRKPDSLVEALWTRESPMPGEFPRGEWVISFSGGVADCIERVHPWLEFGDLGPVLGQVIGQSRLCRGNYRLGKETIRATVIGAGCHSTQLSGSTVFHRNVEFPLKNLPVISIDLPDGEDIRRGLEAQDGPCALALGRIGIVNYEVLGAWADAIVRGFGDRPVLVCLEQDAAKALGQAIALRLPPGQSILCLDRIKPGPETYLDVAAPIGPAIPVVLKTLILER